MPSLPRPKPECGQHRHCLPTALAWRSPSLGKQKLLSAMTTRRPLKPVVESLSLAFPSALAVAPRIPAAPIWAVGTRPAAPSPWALGICRTSPTSWPSWERPSPSELRTRTPRNTSRQAHSFSSHFFVVETSISFAVKSCVGENRCLWSSFALG